MNIYEQDFEISVGNVDKSNKLSSVGLLTYLQEIASIHSHVLGYGLNDKERTHLAWVLLAWRIKIYSRPKWHTKLHIKTWPCKKDKLYAYRDYEVKDNFGNLIAIGSSKWILVNTLTETITKFSDELNSLYAPEGNCIFENGMPKLKEQTNYTETFNYTILRRDIDTNNHVNNLHYLEFAFEALPKEIFENLDFSSIEIMYKKECVLGEEITCLYSKISEKEYIVSIKSKDLSELHSIIRLCV